MSVDAVDREDTCELEGPEEINNVALEVTPPATSEVPEQLSSTHGKSHWVGIAQVHVAKYFLSKPVEEDNLALVTFHTVPNS